MILRFYLFDSPFVNDTVIGYLRVETWMLKLL